MEYTAQQAAEAARNIGVDLEGEKIRPEACLLYTSDAADE